MEDKKQVITVLPEGEDVVLNVVTPEVSENDEKTEGED